jgi:hypothetical protein
MKIHSKEWQTNQLEWKGFEKFIYKFPTFFQLFCIIFQSWFVGLAWSWNMEMYLTYLLCCSRPKYFMDSLWRSCTPIVMNLCVGCHKNITEKFSKADSPHQPNPNQLKWQSFIISISQTYHLNEHVGGHW